MDCARIDLVGYHLGLDASVDRDSAEAHLRVCKRCLEGYLTLKRDADSLARSSGRPSDGARARLRRDVQLAFPPPRSRGRLAWLSRPIPLYQGIAAAAFVLLCATTGPRVAHRWSNPRSSSPADGSPVDTARTTAESFNIY